MKKRTTKPEKGNKYYTTKAKGGYSGCIQGSPKDACDALANCVGYSNGRFNELIGSMKYQFTCNAEQFIEKANKYGLKVVKYPTLGGIMVFQKGATLKGADGAGHVFNVEEIIDDKTIYASESAYGKKAFIYSKRSNTNGRWGMGSSYKFRGCIVNPAIGDIHYEKSTFKVNDKVEPIKLENYNGKKLIQYDAYYYITELSGNTAVLSAKRGNKYYIWAKLNTNNIRKVK